MDTIPSSTTPPPPTTTTTTNANNIIYTKKSVSFSDSDNAIVNYLSLEDYSQSEYNNCFYDSLDYHDFKLDVKQTARLIEQQQQQQRKQQRKNNDESISKDKNTPSSPLIKDDRNDDDNENDNDNDNDIMMDFCVRGCEHLTEDGSYHRYETITAGISSVMKYQYYHHQEDDNNNNKNQNQNQKIIANEYSKAVQDCVLSAHKIGLDDESAVKEMMHHHHHHHHKERQQQKPKKQQQMSILLGRIRVVPSFLLFKKKSTVSPVRKGGQTDDYHTHNGLQIFS